MCCVTRYVLHAAAQDVTMPAVNGRMFMFGGWFESSSSGRMLHLQDFYFLEPSSVTWNVPRVRRIRVFHTSLSPLRLLLLAPTPSSHHRRRLAAPRAPALTPQV